MNAIENTDPVVGYIPNHPTVDALTLILRSGAEVVVPCDPLVEVDTLTLGQATLTLRSGRIIEKDLTEFKSENIHWLNAGHVKPALKSVGNHDLN